MFSSRMLTERRLTISQHSMQTAPLPIQTFHGDRLPLHADPLHLDPLPPKAHPTPKQTPLLPRQTPCVNRITHARENTTFVTLCGR